MNITPTATIRRAAACAALAAALASLAGAQTDFTWANPAGSNLFGSGGYVNWDPDLDATTLVGGNNFFISNSLATLTVSGAPTLRSITFDNPSQAALSINTNSVGTVSRLITFSAADTTILSLINSTSTVSFAGANGNLGFILPATGTSTIHVANAAATLDLGGLFNNVSGFGAIHSGTNAAAATIRKTGSGTLVLTTADSQGNRMQGVELLGGTTVVSSTLQLGWVPAEQRANAVVIDGGVLRFTNTGNLTNSAVRGFQVGTAIGTIETTDAILRLPGTFGNADASPGVLRKTGSGILAFQNTATGATHTGGTLLEQGTLAIALGSTFGGVGGAGITASAGTTLHGSGVINGASTFADGASLNVSQLSETTAIAAAVATLTFNDNLTLGDVTLFFDLATTAASDRIELVSGAVLDIGNGVFDLDNFVFNPVTGFGVGTYTLISTDTTVVGTTGSNLTGTIGDFTVNLTLGDAGQGLELIVTSAIPEPSAAAALAGLGMLAFSATRRRRA